MSTLIAPEPPALQSATATPERSLQRLGISGQAALVVAGFCVLFLYHNYLPLFHSDLWGHVAYGAWMLEAGRLPTEDPFTELAAGTPLVATAWLSQVLFALAARGSDPEGLAHLFAGLLLATYLLLLATYYLQTRRMLVSTAGVAAAFLVAWSRHAVQRPENFGLLCLAGLLWLIVACDERFLRFRWGSVAIVTLFAAWANLHGSFVVGLVVLGCWVLGRAMDLFLDSGSFTAIYRDATLRQRMWWVEFAVLGSCLNPYGVDLVLQTILFPAHPNLDTVLEWFPLEMRSLEGLPMAVSWVLTAVILRHSRRRMSAAEVLWLLVFSAAVCLRVRMVAWYAPMWMLALMPHVADVVSRLEGISWIRHRCDRVHDWFRPAFHWTAVTVLMVWMTFAFAPVSRPVLGGPVRRADQVFSHHTPLGVTRYLHSAPPRGLVFAPQWWGDWLAWRGPEGLRVMATTNAIHLLPPRVWNDYLTIATAESGWAQRLDRYRINTVVASIELQPELCRALEDSDDWTIAYEDDVGLVAVRRGSDVPSTRAEERR